MADAKKALSGRQDLGRVVLVLMKLAGWLTLIVAVGIVGLAKPETNTIADRIYQTASKREWNTELLRHIVPVLIAGIGCTSIGMALYFIEFRSRKYALPVSLIVTGSLCLAGLLAYLLSR